MTVLIRPKFISPFTTKKDDYGRPISKDNNIWYEYNSSSTVFIFVHGIFSNSRDCWFFDGSFLKLFNRSKNRYWPDLIYNDPLFNKPSIFLAGFYTQKFNSGGYVLRDASNELYRSLKITKNGIDPVLEKKKIVFITHSTGGIVVRHMLARHLDDFKDKDILLSLIASPSLGSRDADRLKWLANMANQKLGLQLTFNHPLLNDLDADFKDLVNEKKIPGLVGVEGVENHFIVKSLGFFKKDVLVTEESACRYFGSPQRLGNTDHFSAVKPNNRSHPSYELIQDVYENKYLSN